MISFFFILFISLLLIYQDFSSRAVSVWAIVVLAIASLLQFYETDGFWMDIVLNLTYLVMVFLLSWIVMVFVFKKTFSNMIGLGDILFLLAIVPLFEIYEFVYWIVISISCSLVFHVLVEKLLKRPQSTIPLVGYLSICLIFFEINTIWF